APVAAPGNLNVTNEPGAQQQPSLAVDPKDPNHVVMAYMDYSLVSTGYAGIGVVSSHDGGATWSAEQAIPVPADYAGAAGYPVVQFDSNGTAYVAFMAATFLGANKPPVIFPDGSSRINNSPTQPLTRSLGMQANNGIFVANSADGDSWSTATPVA